MCPDCTQEERLLLSDETEYLETLRSLSSARVVVCSNYCLTAGLLMHKESILVPQLSEGLDEEPSPDLLNLLRIEGTSNCGPGTHLRPTHPLADTLIRR
ncbi:Hypothetical protein FKW44_000704 [Caligus rogercresseyi]|uniref:Uncharacterized protein n=1 Tax=Caligus rogercresseyi TaxID=217165 RepID=A0A7T8KHY0_CALRO|nr:Hypothetical protein FKW44_000704 [Caligus rogercresseyi]